MATVLHLFRANQRRLANGRDARFRALEDSGLEAAAHARTGSPRQVLLMDSETLELMELQPGIIRENITTRGINVNGLIAASASAQEMRNWKFASRARPATYWKKIRPGLRRELRGRRGCYAA